MNPSPFFSKSGKKGQWVNVSDDLKGYIGMFVMSVEGMFKLFFQFWNQIWEWNLNVSDRMTEDVTNLF